MDIGAETVIREERRTVGGFLSARYTLTASELDRKSAYGTAYSVRAEVTDLNTGERENGEILDLTRDRALAERVFDLVVRGGVTPVSLECVVVDLITDY